MTNLSVSPIEEINAAIEDYNPFNSAAIDKVQSVWGKGFPDLNTLNAHASQKVLEIIKQVKTSPDSKDKVATLVVTGDPGSGKTQLIGRLRRRVIGDGSAVFIYANTGKYGDLNLLRHQFLQTLVENLARVGSQEVTQWQEVAAAMANASNSSGQKTAAATIVKNIEALIEGRSIAIIPRIFVNPGRQFALYPSDTSSNALPIEQYYRSNFIPTAQKSLAELGSETVQIKAWAKCERCQVLDDSESLDFLSQLTVWTTAGLEQTRVKRGHIFLAYLRVYRLPQPIEIPVHPSPRFIPLPQPLTVTQDTPVLSQTFFEQRCHQMEKRQPPQHPELEELQSAIAKRCCLQQIASLSNNNLAAKELDQDIKQFLGWSSQSIGRFDSDFIWIKTIAEVGNSSDGHQFEKLVRKSLLKLGFTNSSTNPQISLDPEATGGAGGLDFYCEMPYPVVGECKSTKTEKVPDGTPAQLIKLGYKHLQNHFDDCLKLIVAAGELTKPALQTAQGNKISVIRPETLQHLVELQAQYKGAIDLLKLKTCLQDAYGLADDKIEQYLAQVRQDIAVRSHIVQSVKSFQENAGLGEVEVGQIYGAYIGSSPPKPLMPNELHDILIELSSPLTGYLGRRKENDSNRDRFYFLRDLPLIH